MKELQTLSIVSPGFYGLNTQESGLTLSSNFAAITDNVVIDKYGRLGARNGWLMQTDNGVAELVGAKIDFLMEHVNADNTTVTISGGNNKLFKDGDNSNALVDITPAGYTITDNNWKGANIDDHSMLVQAGHPPIICTEETGSFVVELLTAHTEHGAHTPNYGTNYPRDVIAGYGRFWAHDGATVYWSDDIAGAFPYFDGGSSGLLNIASVLPNNVDTITALALHNGFLIIFCERCIVIYAGAENPLAANFSVSDVISGTGCIARNSVQNTGNDLLFLSDLGIRSLGRVIQEKSLPMRDLTKNVRDDLMQDINLERASYGDLNNVCSVYSEVNAFYLLSIPSQGLVYCLDLRQALEDGAARVTKWAGYSATAFLRRRDREVLIGKVNGIGKYTGYTDNGVSYPVVFFSHYTDMGSATTLKILKQIRATVMGGSGQTFVIKTNFNYEDVTTSYTYSIKESNTAQFNINEFNLSEFSVGIAVDSIKASVGGSGNTVQIGFEAEVLGNPLSVQKIDMFVKTGKAS
tara:strand:+ start:7436 stop:9001 length:1566 start_codon:yes stop_codon:yes gene_type:complete